MNRKIFTAAFSLFIIMLQVSPYAQSGADAGKKNISGMGQFSVNDKVLNDFLRIDLIRRDDFWKGKLNTILETEASIVSVENKTQFRRKYRITAVSGSENRILITYYIYTDNEEYIRILQPGEKFGFKGQFVMYTPLNTKRNAYVFDIILEDGAAVVE